MKTVKKNNLFGKRTRYFQLFLHNLRLRKDKNLLNRNFIKNYFFYKFFLKTFKKNKNIFLSRSLFLMNNNKVLINPVFSFKKKLFNSNSKYNDFLVKSKYESLFLTKYLLKKLNLKSYFGLNYYLTSNDIFNNSLINITNNDEYKDIVKLKFIFNNLTVYKSPDYINIFFNYNLYTVNLVEIYKILIILNILKI